MGRPNRQKRQKQNDDDFDQFYVDRQRSRTSIGNDFEEDFHEEKGTLIIDDIYMPPPPIQPTNLEDQTGKRLIIDTIEIENFKSYGGRSVLGPFCKCFNSIVGPNGSGKSNVIDSMLFVFGYRAQKLRMNKISQIIHRSDQMPDLDYAQVNVNFAMIDDKGDGNQEIIESSRFTISRVANKDNSSYYMINSKRVTFANVSKKLQEVGIDLRYNRFLILQGEVEQISLMKPKGVAHNEVGMLEYLEDIIGTSRYKDPIEKLSIKYYELNEKRTHFVNRVNLAHKELKTVRKSKCEAVRSLELDNKKKIEKAKLIQFHKHRLNTKLEKYKNDYNEYHDQVNAITMEEQVVEQEKNKLDDEEKSTLNELNQFKKNSDELKEKFQECNQKDYYLNSKLKTDKDKLKKLETQIVSYQKELERLQKVPSQDDSQIEILEESKISLENDLKEIEEELKTETENAQQDCTDLIKKRDEYNQQLMKFKDEQAGKLTKKNDAYNHYMVLKQQTNSTRDKMEQLQTKVKQINDETEEKTKMIERYQQELPVEHKKLNDCRSQYEKLEYKRACFTEKLNQKSGELHTLKESLSKNKSKDLIKNALMEAKNRGILQGVYGRLGDLGAIDKMYDVAISTACGRLSNFVVDTIDNAQRCVEYLKENNLPPATFIALDKLRVQWQEDVRYPENVKRLFDLVRINDERIRPAFYFALHETLVAEDIDQAKRITSTARYRMVTLRGDLIEMEGAMTGGGKPKSGGMRQSIQQVGSVEEIQTLEKEVEELNEQRQRIDLEIDNVRDTCSKIEKDIEFMEERLKSFKIEIQDSGKRLDQMKKNLIEQKALVEKLKDNPELDKAEQEYEKAKEIYEKEMSKMDYVQEEMKKVDQEIKKILDDRLGALKKKRKKLEQALKDKQTELNQILSEQKSIELNLKKAEENLSNSQKNKEELEDEIKKIRNQIKELEEAVQEIDTKFKQSEEERQKQEEKLNDIKCITKKCAEQLKKIKNQKLDLQQEAEKRFKIFKEKQDKVDRLQAELDSINLNQIQDLQDDNDDALLSPARSRTPCQVEAAEPMDIDEVPETPPEELQQGDSVPVSSNKRQILIPILTVEEIENLNAEQIERNIKHIETELEKLTPNFSAIEEFRKKRKEYNQKVEDLENFTKQRDTYMDHMTITKNKRDKEFQTGFKIIARKLKEMYRTITLGGDADLELIDSLDPFSEGIDFAVRPNKKSWKNNTNLSGGEKTLASLALIFALHYYKPSPLYIMDEIDAALDFRNVSIISNYIKARTRNTQFLIISHRGEMFNLSERLIGIYKPFQISMTIALDPIICDHQRQQTNSQTTNTIEIPEK